MSNIKKKKVTSGFLKVNAVKNNVFFTFTNTQGDVIFNVTCGLCGYRNARKNTPSSVRSAFEKAKEQMSDLGVNDFEVVLNGYGPSLNEVLVLLPTLHKEAKAYSYKTNKAHNGTPNHSERRT